MGVNRKKRLLFIRKIMAVTISFLGIFFSLKLGLPFWVILEQFYILSDGFAPTFIPLLILGFGNKLFLFFMLVENILSKKLK